MNFIKLLPVAFILLLLSFRWYYSILLFFYSCNTIDAPTISMHELGMENSKTVQRGAELHVDAEILADGKISTVSIEFHPEDHGSGEWELEKTFTEFDGLKNAEFHEHFDIPSEAAIGAYHFQLEVVDQEGNLTHYEDEVEVTE